MIKACAVAPVAVFLSVVAMASDWPYPEDIPVTEPVAVGLAGTKPADIVRFLYARGANDARISPDGQWVAYKHSISGEPQLWVVKNDGGWPEQLTFGSQLGWMDAGQAMGFFTRHDSTDELNFTRTLVQLKEKYQAFLTVVRQLRKATQFADTMDLVELPGLCSSLPALLL